MPEYVADSYNSFPEGKKHPVSLLAVLLIGLCGLLLVWFLIIALSRGDLKIDSREEQLLNLQKIDESVPDKVVEPLKGYQENLEEADRRVPVVGAEMTDEQMLQNLNKTSVQ